MKAHLFLIGVLALSLAGCVKEEKQETESEQRERWKSEAEVAARKCCTNEVVGLRDIIELRINTLEHHPSKWDGVVTVDFFNAKGGVERTNFFLKFGTGQADIENQTHIYCFKDSVKTFERDMAVFGSGHSK